MTPAELLALPTLRDEMPSGDEIMWNTTLGAVFGMSSIDEFVPFQMRLDVAALSAVPKGEGIELLVKMESPYINDWYTTGRVTLALFRGTPFAIIWQWGKRSRSERTFLDFVTYGKAMGFLMSFMRSDETVGRFAAMDQEVPDLTVFAGLYFDGESLKEDPLRHSCDLGDNGFALEGMARIIHDRHGDASFSLENPAARRELAEELAVYLRRPFGKAVYEVEVVNFIDPEDGNWIALAARAADGVIAVGMRGEALAQASWQDIAIGKVGTSRDDWAEYLTEISPHRAEQGA